MMYFRFSTKFFFFVINIINSQEFFMISKTVRWLIAHEPEHLFIRTAKAFASIIEQETNGQLKIEILTTAEYCKKYDYDKEIGYGDPLDLLCENKIEMTQTQVHRFAHWSKDFRSLDLPFLFRDHDHATRVLEGEIGQDLCKSLNKTNELRGLAFTYSGGYRVIGSNKPITKFEDFSDLRVRVTPNPVNVDTMAFIGAKPKVMPHNYGYDAIESGDLDAAETTYLRFKGTHIVKTNHSMFLTTIAVNENFYNSLDEETQIAMNRAALKAARLERQWSIEDAKQFEKDCEQNGITITTLSQEDQEKFRTKALNVHKAWRNEFYPGLIDKITKH